MRRTVKFESSRPSPLSVDGDANRLILAGVLEYRVLGGQPLLRFVKLGRLAVRVFERFHRADRFVLVRVGGRVLKRLHPVARKHGGVLSRCPLLVAAITARPVFCSAVIDPPLELVVLTINWRLAGMWSHRLASSAPEMSGPTRLNLYSTPSNDPCPIRISTKSSSGFASLATALSVSVSFARVESLPFSV